MQQMSQVSEETMRTRRKMITRLSTRVSLVTRPRLHRNKGDKVWSRRLPLLKVRANSARIKFTKRRKEFSHRMRKLPVNKGPNNKPKSQKKLKVQTLRRKRSSSSTLRARPRCLMMTRRKKRLRTSIISESRMLKCSVERSRTRLTEIAQEEGFQRTKMRKMKTRTMSNVSKLLTLLT